VRLCCVDWIKDCTDIDVGSRERGCKKTHNTQLLKHKVEKNCSEAPGAITSVESTNERVVNEYGNDGAKSIFDRSRPLRLRKVKTG